VTLKLRTNTGPKSLILAVTAGLFVGLLSLVRAYPPVEPTIVEETFVDAVPDYDEVFRGVEGTAAGLRSAGVDGPSSAESSSIPTHTRTRGS
jgi:hypothetical protein